MRRGLIFGAAALAAAVLLPATRTFAVTDWALNSWESGLEGWHADQAGTVGLSTVGATDGTQTMVIGNNATTGFQWAATVEYNAANNADPIQANGLAAFNWAGSGNESNSWLEFDVIYRSLDNPVTWMNMLMSINSNNGWTQSQVNLGDAWVDHDQVVHVVTPMIGAFSGFGTNKLPDGDAQWVQIHLAINGGWAATDAVNIRVDNLHLFTPLVPEPASMGLLAAAVVTGLARRRR